MAQRTTPRLPGEDELEAATARFRKAEQVMRQRRHELHDAIIDVIEAGMSKSEVARRTGYTREYVAKICDMAGH